MTLHLETFYKTSLCQKGLFQSDFYGSKFVKMTDSIMELESSWLFSYF